MSSGIAFAPQFVAMGETLAALSSPHSRPLRHVRSLDLSIGGAESNAAVAAARLGVRAAWIGRVGDDELGRLVVRELTAEGIDVHATVDSEHPTALMLKSRRTSGLMNVDYYRTGSAGSCLRMDDVDPDIISSAAVLHVSAITPALSVTAREAVHFAISVAKAAGTTVSVDLNYRSALWSTEQAAPEFRALAASADILFATVHEARVAVDGETPDELATGLAALGAQQVIVKLGSRGAMCWEDGVTTSVDPFPTIAIDDVGAGDAFAGGFLASLIGGGDLEQRLSWAAALGAWAVSTAGDWEGSPTIPELSAFLSTSENADTVLR